MMGGVARMARLAAAMDFPIDEMEIGAWLKSPDGLIPTQHIKTILILARFEGVFLSAYALDPRSDFKTEEKFCSGQMYRHRRRAVAITEGQNKTPIDDYFSAVMRIKKRKPKPDTGN